MSSVILGKNCKLHCLFVKSLGLISSSFLKGEAEEAAWEGRRLAEQGPGLDARRSVRAQAAHGRRPWWPAAQQCPPGGSRDADSGQFCCTCFVWVFYSVHFFNFSSRIPNPNFFHPGSPSKNSSILTQIIFSKLSEIWSGLFIPDPDPDFFTHPGSRIQELKGIKSRIRIRIQ